MPGGTRLWSPIASVASYGLAAIGGRAQLRVMYVGECASEVGLEVEGCNSLQNDQSPWPIAEGAGPPRGVGLWALVVSVVGGALGSEPRMAASSVAGGAFGSESRTHRLCLPGAASARGMGLRPPVALGTRGMWPRGGGGVGGHVSTEGCKAASARHAGHWEGKGHPSRCVGLCPPDAEGPGPLRGARMQPPRGALL